MKRLYFCIGITLFELAPLITLLITHNLFTFVIIYIIVIVIDIVEWLGGDILGLSADDEDNDDSDIIV